MVAPHEHVGDEPLGHAGIVVQVREHPFDALAHVPAFFEPIQEAARGLPVQRGRVLDHFRLGAELRQHRHLPRERGAQRVDGLHAKPLRAFLELPAQRVVACERGARDVPGARFMRRIGARRRARAPQRLQHAAAHLRGRLDGERDGGNLLRAIHARQ
jgi:hypothetical protein